MLEGSTSEFKVEFKGKEPMSMRDVVGHFKFLEAKNEYSAVQLSMKLNDDLRASWAALSEVQLRPVKATGLKVTRLLKKIADIKHGRRGRYQKPTPKAEQIARSMARELDDLFDITACKCELVIVPCAHREVKCRTENCQSEHLLCYCPIPIPRKYRQYIRFRRTGLGRNDFCDVADQEQAQNPEHQDLFEELAPREEPEDVAYQGLLLEGLQEEPLMSSQRSVSTQTQSTQTQSSVSTQTSVSMGTQCDEVSSQFINKIYFALSSASCL